MCLIRAPAQLVNVIKVFRDYFVVCLSGAPEK